MSRDCEYLFVWENQPYVLGEPAPLAQKALESVARGSALAIDDRTLFWSCAKHGLVPEQLVFPIPADQIFERANGGLFEPVTWGPQP